MLGAVNKKTIDDNKTSASINQSSRFFYTKVPKQLAPNHYHCRQRRRQNLQKNDTAIEAT